MAMLEYHGTRADLVRLLQHIPAVLGGAPDPNGIARGIQLRAGNVLVSKVQQAFIVKSRGGTGEDGIKWKPLKRETIAQRRTTRSERKALGITGTRVRGLLTPAQDRRWRQIYGSRLARLLASGVGGGEARATAARIAWAILKSEGAMTKLDVLGGRQVDILRDTGELLRSFTPGVEDKPSGADGQVFKLEPSRVIIGSNKKPQHHTGIPGRLPARPFWPPDGSLPRPWSEAILGSIQRGMVRAIVLLVEQGRVI
jgi:hypothetical protein